MLLRHQNRARTLVNISGMPGSGKTTLLQGLATAKLGQPVHESSLGISYLQDMYTDPARWALEAQLAFLIEKSIAIRSSCSRTLIVDRSLEEDYIIFFRYWMDNFIKDARSQKIYESAYELLSSVGPRQTVHVFCDVSLKVAKARLLRRKTDVHYFSGHLEDIYSRYNAYREIVEQKENVIFVDSQSTDWRQIPAIETIASRIRAFITIPGEVNEK